MTRFDTNIPVPLAPRVHTDIEYVNAIPGVGKTYTYQQALMEHHRQHQTTIPVVAVPTDMLAKQVRRDLIKEGVPDHKIKLVSSRSGDGRVADLFRDALVGSKKRMVQAVSAGTILIVTHECIAKAAPDMPGKDRVVLIYDEARECLQPGFTLDMPERVYQHLLNKKDPSIIQTSVARTGKDDTGTALYLWRWLEDKELPTFDEVYAMVDKTKTAEAQVRKILSYLDFVYKSSLDVYVTVTRIAKKDKAEYKVNIVFSPARMFYGYAKVLILSAYFENAQMYHFLKNNHERYQVEKKKYDDRFYRHTTGKPNFDDYLTYTRDLPIEERVVLHDITDSYISKKRKLAMLRKLQKCVDITYIYDRPNLSKNDMINGVPYKGELTWEEANAIHTMWLDTHRSTDPTSKTPKSYRTIVKESTTDGMYFTTKNHQAQIDFVTAGMVSKLSVVRHMVTQAKKIQQAWAAQAGIDPEPLLVGVNAKFRGYGGSKEEVWMSEQLDKVPNIHQLKMVCHGQNQFKKYHSVAFLASMLYADSEVAFLRMHTPSYDPQVDRTLDFALQVLFRCNVRDLDSQDKVLFIVPTKGHAEALATRLLGASSIGRLVKSPSSIYKKFKSSSVLTYSSPEDKEANLKRVKNYQSTDKGKLLASLKKEWLASDGSAYNALTLKISRARKQGKPTSEFESKRASLLSFARWQKTEKGIKAYEALTRAGTQEKSTKSTPEKLLTVLNDPRFWSDDRGDRLPYIKAAAAAQIDIEAITSYPGGQQDLRKNWPSSNDWTYERSAKFILAKAKKLNIRF
jgi:hypothetical protein